MRINRLDLRAFGMFTGLSLDFAEGDRGLQLIYGPNEAGKSTSLRALRGWLFGFPQRLDDDFVHAYSTIRVGGVLADETGQEHELIRRKAVKKSLRLGDDEAEADEDLLKNKLLGGITQELFDRMFTIDYSTLKSGGEATLKSGGDFAKLLFGSGLDLAGVRKYQERLEQQIEQLFKPNGQNPKINQSLRQIEEKRKEIDAASIKGSDWSERTKALSDLKEERARVDEDWRRVSLEKEHWTTIRQARSDLARRVVLKLELEGLQDAPKLVADFSKRRCDAEESQRICRAEKTALETERERLRLALGEVPPRSAILNDAEAITAIQTQLGHEQAAAQTRAKNSRNRAEHLKTARELLQALGRAEPAESASAHRLKPSLKAKIRQLAEKATANDAQRVTAIRAVESARKKRDECSKEIAALPQAKRIDGLQRAIDRTRGVADSIDARSDLTRELAKLERAAKAAYAKLGDIPHAMGVVAALAIPPTSVLAQWSTEFANAESVASDARKACEAVEDRHRGLSQRLDRLIRGSDLPDESMLKAQRMRRDAGWSLILAEWQGTGANPDELREYLGIDQPVERLAFAFEEAVHAADDTADRLRGSAKEVAERAGLHADIAEATGTLAILKSRKDAAVRDFAALNERWNRLWAPFDLKPGTPQEMITWASHHTVLAEKLEQLAECRDRLSSMDTVAAAAVADLHRELRELGEGVIEGEALAAARDRATSVIVEQHAEATKRTLAEQAIAEAERSLNEATSEREAIDRQITSWNEQWRTLVQELGLSDVAAPDEAQAMLDLTAELSKTLDEARKIADEIEDLDAASERFHASLDALLRVHSPGTLAVSHAAAIGTLRQLLSEAEQAEARRNTLSESLQRSEAAIQHAEVGLESSRLALEGLAREAGVHSAEGLAEVERRAMERADRERELREVESRLIALAPGRSIDELDQAAAAISNDELLEKLLRAEEEFAELDQTRHDLSTRIGQVSEQLRGFESQAREATVELAATEREHLMGMLETDVERYVHLKLSLAVLKGAIEEYRSQNEAPILRRASHYFRSLTSDSFTGLRVDLDDKGEPVLVGVRADHAALVGVNGMSVGTADQLYLAMKLASIDHYFESRPPLPLVVDDLLVQFDDERAIAALRCLGELSRRTQVLFFTHHDHLVRLAQESLPTDVVFVHRLPGRTRSRIVAS